MTASNNTNMKLWKKVCKTDPAFTKEVSGFGQKYTAIDAQYQIQNATKEFGPYGKTWGLKETNFSRIDGLPNGEIILVLNAVFFAPEIQFPVSSSIKLTAWVKSSKYLKVDVDAYKKVETDVTTKALSKLGFNADVFIGKFEDAKYRQQRKLEVAEEAGEEIELKPLPDSKFKACLNKFVNGDFEQFKKVEKNGYSLSDEQKEEILKVAEEMKDKKS
jgi:hypothetical protein